MFDYFWSRVKTIHGSTRKRIVGVKTRQIETKRVDLTTGGFIEFVWDWMPDTAYIRIHLGVPAHPHDLDETYKYVRNGSEKQTVKLLRELKMALMDLEGNL